MSNNSPNDILVVGAGPVGLFAAILLSERGCNVRIIDSAWRPGAHSYALALHPQTLELLETVGLARDVVQLGRRVEKIGVYDGPERRGTMDFNGLPGRFPLLMILRQDLLEDLLIRRLARNRVQVQWNHALTALAPNEQRVVATVEKWGSQSRGYAVASTQRLVEQTLSLATDFVVGADGHNSTVRRLCEIDFPPRGDGELFAVFEMQADGDLADEARLIFQDGLVSTLWPMPGGRCRWSFQLRDTELTAPRRKSRLAIEIADQHYPYLDEDHLRRLLERRAPWFTSAVPEIFWSIVVRFERRRVGRMNLGRIALAGDAAHLTGPVGMQSMNVGLQEAKRLARILTDRRGDKVANLTAYSDESLRAWDALTGDQSPLTAGAQTPPGIAPLAAALRGCIPATGAALNHLARQLGLESSQPVVPQSEDPTL